MTDPVARALLGPDAEIDRLASEIELLRSIVRKLLAVDPGNWPARNCLHIDLTANEAHLVDTLTKENR
jgi:hypothetical protein